MMTTDSRNTCVSKKAIEYHYDLSNDFYSLFLDKHMVYSCALWDSAGDHLDEAQERKIEFHIKESRADQAKSILDIGCGWGAILKQAVEKHGVKRAVGLTLSNNQYDYINALNHPNITVRLESWQDHEPERIYDAIISTGAFPHFARPEMTSEEKIAGYRHFFEKCRQWLKPKGILSLDTMAHGYIKPEDRSDFFEHEIFPESEIPTLTEIVTACDGIFEITRLRNDPEDYERTNEQWRRRLKRYRNEAEKIVGLDNYKRYEKYFSFMTIAFFTRRLSLLRLTMRRIDI